MGSFAATVVQPVASALSHTRELDAVRRRDGAFDGSGRYRRRWPPGGVSASGQRLGHLLRTRLCRPIRATRIRVARIWAAAALAQAGGRVWPGRDSTLLRAVDLSDRHRRQLVFLRTEDCGGGARGEWV